MELRDITVEQVRRIFSLDATTGCLIWRIVGSNRASVGAIAGTVNKSGNRTITVLGRKYPLWRLLALYRDGVLPTGRIPGKGRTKIPLTHPRLLEVLNYDSPSGLFIWKIVRPKARNGKGVVGAIAGTLDGEGYRWIKIDGIDYQSAPLAHFYVTSEWPDTILDHANGDRDDNAWDNLRPATKSQNGANMKLRRDNMTGLKGVHGRPGRTGKWWSEIVENGNRHYLGTFDTPEAAHAAYVAAAKHYFGEFANDGAPTSDQAECPLPSSLPV